MCDAYLSILLERLLIEKKDGGKETVLEHREIVMKSEGRIILNWI